MTAALNLADQGFETFLIERPIVWAAVARRISPDPGRGADVQAISPGNQFERVVRPSPISEC